MKAKLFLIIGVIFIFLGSLMVLAQEANTTNKSFNKTTEIPDKNINKIQVPLGNEGCKLTVGKSYCYTNKDEKYESPDNYVEAGEQVKVGISDCSTGDLHNYLSFDKGGEYNFVEGYNSPGLGNNWNANFPGYLQFIGNQNFDKNFPFYGEFSSEDLREYVIELGTISASNNLTCELPITIRDTTAPVFDKSLGKISAFCQSNFVFFDCKSGFKDASLLKYSLNYGDGKSTESYFCNFQREITDDGNGDSYEFGKPYTANIIPIDKAGNLGSSNPISVDCTYLKAIISGNDASGYFDSLTKQEINANVEIPITLSALKTTKATNIGQEILKYKWDFNSDGVVDKTGAGPFQYTFDNQGIYYITLEVQDNFGDVSKTKIKVEVRNDGKTPPQATIIQPCNNDEFQVNSPVVFKGNVKDREDDLTSLNVSWVGKLNSQEIFDTKVIPDSTGEVEYSYVFNKEGNYEIFLKAKDSDGMESSTKIEIKIANSPIGQTCVSDSDCNAGYICNYNKKCVEFGSGKTCIDLDGPEQFCNSQGCISNPNYNNPEIKGTILFSGSPDSLGLLNKPQIESSSNSISDKCLGSIQVIEFSCSGGQNPKIKKTIKNCPEGFACYDGACVDKKNRANPDLCDGIDNDGDGIYDNGCTIPKTSLLSCGLNPSTGKPNSVYLSEKGKYGKWCNLDEESSSGAINDEIKFNTAEFSSLLSKECQTLKGSKIEYADSNENPSFDIYKHDQPEFSEKIKFYEDIVMQKPVCSAFRDNFLVKWENEFRGSKSSYLYFPIITEAWDASHLHSSHSLHYEGRALDIVPNPIKGESVSLQDKRIGRMAWLAHISGFSWSNFEGNHLHVSLKATKAQKEKSNKQPIYGTTIADKTDNEEYPKVYPTLPPNKSIIIFSGTNKNSIGSPIYKIKGTNHTQITKPSNPPSPIEMLKKYKNQGIIAVAYNATEDYPKTEIEFSAKWGENEKKLNNHYTDLEKVKAYLPAYSPSSQDPPVSDYVIFYVTEDGTTYYYTENNLPTGDKLDFEEAITKTPARQKN